MIIKVAQKVALGLMITAIAPSTHAMEKHLLRVHGVAVENDAQASVIYQHPQARAIVESYKSTPELDKPTIPELVEEAQKSKTLSGQEIVSNASVSEQDVIDQGFTDKTEALIAKRSGLSTKDVESANTMKDLFANGDFNDVERHDREIIQFYHQERLTTGAVDHDALIRKIALNKLDCHNVGAEHDPAYKRLTDASARHVKIRNPSGIDVDTAAAWRVAGNKNPAEVQFNLIKTLLTAVYHEDPRIILPIEEFVHSAEALSGGVDLTDKQAVEGLIGDAIGAAYREIELGYPAVNLPGNAPLVQTMKLVYQFLKTNGYVNENEVDPLAAVDAKYVDALLEMLNPANKAAILGVGNEPSKEDVQLFVWLREIELQTAGVTIANAGTNPTAIRLAQLTVYKNIATRINTNKAKYLIDDTQPYTHEDIKAIHLLDNAGMNPAHMDAADVESTKIITLSKKSKKRYLNGNRLPDLHDVAAFKHLYGDFDPSAFNHEDVTAVRYIQTNPRGLNFGTIGLADHTKPSQDYWRAVKLLQVQVAGGAAVGVVRPSLEQIAVVGRLSQWVDFQQAVIWRIQQENVGTPGYLPAGVAKVTAIDAGAHTVDFAYAQFAPFLGGPAADRIANNKLKVDDASIAGLPRFAALAEGDIVTFEDLADNAATAGVVDMAGANRQ